jgi:hypothetical protein
MRGPCRRTIAATCCSRVEWHDTPRTVVAGLDPAIHQSVFRNKMDARGPATPTAFVRRRTSAVKRLRRGSAVLARRSFSEGGKPGDDEWSGSLKIELANIHVVPDKRAQRAPRIRRGFGACSMIAARRQRCACLNLQGSTWKDLTSTLQHDCVFPIRDTPVGDPIAVKKALLI